MESQLHRPRGHEYDDPLNPTDLHGEEERGGETRSAMKRVKEKVDKLKATIKHGHGGHHKDEPQSVNDSPVVRSGLAEPTVMGTPVLAEDLYTTHSDIVDTPVRSFAQWEDEERHGAPPPLSTGYETHLTDLPHVGHHAYGDQDASRKSKGITGKLTGMEEEDRRGESRLLAAGIGGTQLTDLPRVGQHVYGQDVNREQWKDHSIEKPSGLKEESRHGAPLPLSTGYGTHPTDPFHVDYGTHPTDPLYVDRKIYDQDVNAEQWEGSIGKPSGLKEENRGVPLPPSSGYETHLSDPLHVDRKIYDQDVNREPLKDSIGKPIGLDEERHDESQLPSARIYGTPLTETMNKDKGGEEVGITGEEVGITGVLRSFDKMKVFDEPEAKSLESHQNEPKVYTGSHDQFAPEPVENPPPDTATERPSNHSSDYTQRISSAASAIAHKAAEMKDSIVSKLSSSGEASPVSSPKTNKKSPFPTDFSHKVADTLSSTLGPVYEKVAGAGSSVASKMQGIGHDETTGGPTEGKGVTVKEYLVETFKPGDDDKVLSEVITHAFHRGKGNERSQETTTTYVIRKEEERRLQDSGN